MIERSVQAGHLPQFTAHRWACSWPSLQFLHTLSACQPQPSLPQTWGSLHPPGADSIEHHWCLSSWLSQQSWGGSFFHRDWESEALRN